MPPSTSPGPPSPYLQLLWDRATAGKLTSRNTGGPPVSAGAALGLEEGLQRGLARALSQGSLGLLLRGLWTINSTGP